ncbi:hypothetical protein MYX77_06715 [Acidobacteriia bacterium AH_259_A11_L15]|nr:hypothetical protein [Acidobacteriia bacterium AH_259_A11_L15]
MASSQPSVVAKVLNAGFLDEVKVRRPSGSLWSLTTENPPEGVRWLLVHVELTFAELVSEGVNSEQAQQTHCGTAAGRITASFDPTTPSIPVKHLKLLDDSSAAYEAVAFGGTRDLLFDFFQDVPGLPRGWAALNCEAHLLFAVHRAEGEVQLLPNPKRGALHSTILLFSVPQEKRRFYFQVGDGPRIRLPQISESWPVPVN